MDIPVTSRLHEQRRGEVLYYTFPAFDRLPMVVHGFSTRLGGVSKGIFQSMNLSFTRGDNRENVMENFRRFCGALGVSEEHLVLSAQEHHVHLYNATAADRGRGIRFDRGYSDIDGLMTDEPDVVLCTQYADCVPLFFADPVRRVVATSHAGWRGTAARIGEVTVERLCRDYGCRREDILAGIGPSIGVCCFEVDAPVFEAFAALPEFNDGCFSPRPAEKYHIDLWEINRRILRSAGLRDTQITVTDLCTRCHPDIFWSHRYTGPQRGSLAGLIALKGV